MEQAQAKVAALQPPDVVLLARSPNCDAMCEVSLVWLDVANQKVLGVKKLQTSHVKREGDVEKWAASR